MKLSKNNGAYEAPKVVNFAFCCEQGFAQSATVDGLTPVEGEWDE